MEYILNEIFNFVLKKHVENGLIYDEDKIEYLGKFLINKYIKHQFFVRDSQLYFVNIYIKNNSLKKVECDCETFKKENSCPHIAACILNYSDRMFSLKKEKNNLNQTKDLFTKIESSLNNNQFIKKEIKLIPILKIGYYNGDYYETYLSVKIGDDSLYTMLGKFDQFLKIYQANGCYSFGLNFTFNGQKHFFNEQSLKLLNYLKKIRGYQYKMENQILIEDDDLTDLLTLYKQINVNGNLVDIKREFPLSFNLELDKNKYILNVVDNLSQVFPLTSDKSIIYYNQNIYLLNESQQILIKELYDNELSSLIFLKDEFELFKRSALRIIKNKITLDEKITDIKIGKTPLVKLYFDINEMDITCNPKFIYDREISYFEKDDSIIKDQDFEEQVIKELITFGFQLKDNQLYMIDLEKIYNFIDETLEPLSKKYQIYTTENFKNIKLIKKNSIETQFSIGKDQILHYDFQLENIENSELDSILKAMDENKKYYRLKSGDILNLDQSELQEFKNLTTDLDLSPKDIIRKHGTIPKYRALYLDLLKEQKYNIIKTDSPFQNFINQFQEYQKCDLSFTKNEQTLLRDYQVSGIKWLYTICKCGLGGVLADEMGLGKSLQTITLIKKMLKENKNAKFLIVCPTSLVYNWENEFKKFAPQLHFATFAGLKKDRLSSLKNYRGNIYITSYGLLREDIEFYQKINFQIFIIDEAQAIKNPHTFLSKAVKEITSDTKLALTGTPIENSIVELWSIFDFIMPGFLSNLTKFQKKYKIKDFDDETNKLLDNLKMQVKPFILRRKKSEVMKELPPKIENNIYIDLNPMQKKYYAIEVKKVNEEMDSLIKNGGFKKNEIMILRLLTRLKQICVDPKIVYKNYKEESAKMENLIKIIKEVISNNHKILLFTSFKTALEIVHDKLEKEGITSYTIAGDVPSKKRALLVDAFNNDDTNVFLIMLKSGGTGLNLTSADVVIHLDLWWNPQAENQATDRTHRIGQTKTVEVIKLICKGTIEEKILNLQEKKKILSDKIIENNLNDEKYLQNLTEKDIRALISYENN